MRLNHRKASAGGALKAFFSALHTLGEITVGEGSVKWVQLGTTITTKQLILTNQLVTSILSLFYTAMFTAMQRQWLGTYRVEHVAVLYPLWAHLLNRLQATSVKGCSKLRNFGIAAHCRNVPTRGIGSKPRHYRAVATLPKLVPTHTRFSKRVPAKVSLMHSTQPKETP